MVFNVDKLNRTMSKSRSKSYISKTSNLNIMTNTISGKMHDNESISSISKSETMANLKKSSNRKFSLINFNLAIHNKLFLKTPCKEIVEVRRGLSKNVSQPSDDTKLVTISKPKVKQKPKIKVLYIPHLISDLN